MSYLLNLNIKIIHLLLLHISHHHKFLLLKWLLKLPFLFLFLNNKETKIYKNIPTATLPKFYGLLTEDPKTFLFEFDILCWSYDYTTDAHKLKLFPSTLKEATLRWFMGLGANVVADWDAMHTLFLTKYKEYYRGQDLKGDDIFKMS